jgi:hypothetical protein
MEKPRNQRQLKIKYTFNHTYLLRNIYKNICHTLGLLEFARFLSPNRFRVSPWHPLPPPFQPPCHNTAKSHCHCQQPTVVVGHYLHLQLYCTLVPLHSRHMPSTSPQSPEMSFPLLDRLHVDEAIVCTVPGRFCGAWV